MWADPDEWSPPYYELRVACYECSEPMGTHAPFEPAATFTCFTCGAAFSQEEGILRMLLRSVEDCEKRVESSDEPESELLKFVDNEVFWRGRFGHNVSLNYTGYLKNHRPHEVAFTISFRRPPKSFMTVHTGGTMEGEVLGFVVPSELDHVPIAAYGRTPSGGAVPFSLQVHGTAEEGAVTLPPHFVFLENALRAVANRDYALAVFLGATATEAFVDSLLTDLLSEGSDRDAVFELVSVAPAKRKATKILPKVLGTSFPKELSRPYESRVGGPRNDFAHGKLPNTTLREALEALNTCVSCITWALRKAAEIR